MKFSVITPEHTEDNLPFLIELFDSLKNQTYEDWEWILFLNNGIKQNYLPEYLVNHEKVYVYLDPNPIDKKIGRIKNEAFSLGSGDILVEVDHDDQLTPDCLEELYKVYSSDSEIGFVYSDVAMYDMRGDWTPYRPDFGWEWRPFKFKDLNLKAPYSWDVSSHTVSQIYYGPDHVRSWRKEVYNNVGKHDRSYDVCDDQELIIRTYLNTKIHHIKKPLYIYRITGNNTWMERVKKIRETSWDLFHENIRTLVAKDCKDKGLLKVDIGGGLNPFRDYITIDLRPEADIQGDLNEKFPLEDNSVGLLNAHHILEHLKNPMFSMQEIYRVLAHGGWAFIEVPSTDGRGAWQDPTHISYWNKNSFWYYTDRNYAEFADAGVRFQVFKLEDYFPTKFMRDNNILVTCAVLVAIKNNNIRFPGPLKI